MNLAKFYNTLEPKFLHYYRFKPYKILFLYWI